MESGEAAIRVVICEVLREGGFETIDAGSGREGLERLKEASVDAIVMDLRSGDMTGKEMLQRLGGIRAGNRLRWC